MSATLALGLGAVAIMGLGLLALAVRHVLDQQRYQIAAAELVDALFAEQPPAPSVRAVPAYGAPFITLIFDTDAAKNAALDNGLVDQFLGGIQDTYGHLQIGGVPFAASRAVAVCSKQDTERDN